MRTREPHRLRLLAHHDIERTAFDYGQFVLADLVALGQVGIKIILAGEYRATVYLAVHGQPETDRALNRALVQYRQHAGQRDIDRARLRIRTRAECGGTARKYLGARRQLRMRFKPNDYFPLHGLNLISSPLRTQRTRRKGRKAEGENKARLSLAVSCVL